jgi:hypothetical protein
MFAVVQNGAVRQVLQMDVPFSVGDKHYSSNFLRTSSAQEKLEAGVWEIIEGARPDDRFYWVSGPNYRVVEVSSTVEASYSGTAKALDDKEEVDANGNPLWVQVLGTVNGQPAMVDSDKRLVTKGLKSQWTAQTKTTAGGLLAATDWMVIRKAERSVDIPASVVTYRAAVVAECARMEAQISAATSVQALVDALAAANWPKPE